MTNITKKTFEFVSLDEVIEQTAPGLMDHEDFDYGELLDEINDDDWDVVYRGDWVERDCVEGIIPTIEMYAKDLGVEC